MYQTRHSFASNALAAGEAPSWVAAMLGHTTPEMLFTVYARWIPNRTRRDGSALAARMAGGGTASGSGLGERRGQAF
jgi:integrase